MRLSEFVQINPSVKLTRGKDYPCVMMEDVTPGRRYVRAQTERAYKGGAVFIHGDTLFARITPCLENGKIAQFRSEQGHAGFGSTEFIVMRAREGISDPSFVYYLASSDLIRKPAEKSMFGASGRQRADLKVVQGIEIDAPDLPIQRRIASILSAYDDLIENNTRRIRILEEMAQMLYREWFVHFRFPGHERVKMVDSEMRRIPEGWEVKTLGSIAIEVRRSVQPNQIDPNTPYIGLEHMPRKSIALNEWGTASQVQSTKMQFKRGEILFGKIRPYFHKVGVAPLDGVCSSDIIVIQPIAAKYFAIVLGCASSDDFVKHATQTSQGTKMPRANWDVLTKYPIAIPNDALFGQFNDFIGNIITEIQNLVFRNINLRATRDLLLPKLISGEVEVGGMDVDVGMTV